MRRKKKKSGGKFFVGLLLLDQLLKWFALNFGEVVFNQGISFGFLPIAWPLGVILLISFFLVVWFLMTDEIGERLIIVGGLSNLIDRVVHGQVVDYLNIPLIGLWVNLGDVYINIGVLLMIWSLVSFRPKR